MRVPIEWYRTIRTNAIEYARKQNIARTMMPVQGPIGGIGVQQYSWDITEEGSEALVTYQFVDLAEDATNMTRDHIAIPLIQKDFRIDRRDLATAQRGGYSISTKNSNEATYQIMVAENKMVIQGYSTDGKNYEIKGLLNGAGETPTSSYDFATPGNALKAAGDAIEIMMGHEIYGPYNMTLNPQQWTQLTESLLTGGVSELSMVEKMNVSVKPTNWIPAGKMVFTPDPDENNYEIVMAQDLTVETEILQKSKNLWGRIYESLVPVIYKPESIIRFDHV